MIENEIREIASNAELGKCEEEICSFLRKHDVRSSVYHEPAYIKAYVDCDEKISLWRYYLVLDSSKGIIAALPLFISNEKLPLKLGFYNFVSVRVRQLRIFGNFFPYLESQYNQRLFSSIEAILNKLRSSYDIGIINAVNVEDEFYNYMHKKHGPISFEPLSNQIEVVRLLEFPTNWDEYLASMKRKRRYNLKRSVRKLEERCGGSLTVIPFKTVTDVFPFLCLLNEIYNETWQASTFGTRDRTSLLEQKTNEALADIGAFQSYVLSCSGEPIAFLRGYLYKGKYYFEEIGYKKQWRDSNPGNVLSFLGIKALFEECKPKVLDFGYGENVYKQVLGNRYYNAINVFLVPEGSKGKKILSFQRALYSLYFKIRKIIVGIGLDVKLRKILKRKS